MIGSVFCIILYPICSSNELFKCYLRYFLVYLQNLGQKNARRRKSRETDKFRANQQHIKDPDKVTLFIIFSLTNSTNRPQMKT